jgi:hypothetical protein
MLEICVPWFEVIGYVWFNGSSEWLEVVGGLAGGVWRNYVIMWVSE